MSSREELLARLPFSIHAGPKPAATYAPVATTGSLAFVSGQLPIDHTGNLSTEGHVGTDVTLSAAKDAAALAAFNVLLALRTALGSLDRIARVVKITGFVSSAPGFTEQHLVLNGASELFVSVLGEAGRHARAAVGVAALPLGASVEVEAIVEVTGEVARWEKAST